MDHFTLDELQMLYRAARKHRISEVLGRVAMLYGVLVVPLLAMIFIIGPLERQPLHEIIDAVLRVLIISAVLTLPVVPYFVLFSGRIRQSFLLVDGRIIDKQTHQIPNRYGVSTVYSLVLAEARYRKLNSDGSLETHRPLERIKVYPSDFNSLNYGQSIRALCYSDGKLIQLV